MPSLHGYTMGTYKEEKVSEAVTRTLDPKTRRGKQKLAQIGSLSNVRLYVASETSLAVRFDVVDPGLPAEPFKVVVEWSLDTAFNQVVGQHLIEGNDIQLEYEITGLQSGTRYFVRVFFNVSSGRGDAVTSVPSHATPSSWKDLEKTHVLDTGDFDVFLASLLRDYRKMLTSNQVQLDTLEPSAYLNQTRKPGGTKRASWKSLFSTSVRFHKTLKAGLYFVCVMYHEDRIVANGDEHLPIVLVDGACPVIDQSLPADLLWLMRLSHAWSTVDELREKMERLSGAAGSLELRLKMLRTVSLLQAAFGTQDLGQVFCRVLEDEGSGAVAMVFVNRITDIKTTNLSSPLKWLSRTRLERRPMVFVDRLADFVCYHQASCSPLSRGLYLGLMLTRVSVDSIYVLVNAATPNVIPNIQLRDRPHVSCMEWSWLTGRNRDGKGDAVEGQDFVQLVINGFKELAHTLGIRDEEIPTYRLYDAAVVQLSSDISFIVFVPPRDSACAVSSREARNSSLSLSGHMMELPFKIFELVHLGTYNPSQLRAYAETIAHMDVDSQLAQHAARTALTSEEAAIRQAHLNNILWYHQQAEDRWHMFKWPLNVLAFSRDKANRGNALQFLSALLAGDDSALSLSPAGSGRSSAQRRKQKISDFPCSESSRIVTGDETLRNLSLKTPSPRKDDNDAGTPSPAPQSQRLRSRRKNNPLKATLVRVHASYDCGLAAGTSVLLHVTQKTTCREVVNLVVDRLQSELLNRHGGNFVEFNRQISQKTGQRRLDEEEEREALLDFCLVIELENGCVILPDHAFLLDWRYLWQRQLLSVKRIVDIDENMPRGRVRFTAL